MIGKTEKSPEQDLFQTGDKVSRTKILNMETGQKAKKGKIGILGAPITIGRRIQFKNHPMALGYPVSGIIVEMNPKQARTTIVQTEKSFYEVQMMG